MTRRQPCDRPDRLLLVVRLLLSPVAVGTQTVFTTRSALLTAVNLWYSDESQARATHGEINTWDVSQVTSMELLFNDKVTFNSDISNWDVSEVTNMVCALPPHAPCSCCCQPLTAVARPLAGLHVRQRARL